MRKLYVILTVTSIILFSIIVWIFNKPYDLYSLREIENSITPTSVNFRLRNYSLNPVYYGSSYELEKKENGKWVEVKMISDYIAFRSTLFRIGRFSSVVIEEYWGDTYGRLENGEYRYSKELYINTEEKQIKSIVRIYCVFTIAANDKHN